METKSLLYGIIGFFLGGLLVSVAAATFDQPETDMSQMTSQLKEKSDSAYDSAFIANMIDHHQAAINMAQLSEARAKHEEIKHLSRNVISAQQKEVDQMRQWQEQWGYPTYSSGHETSH